MNRIILNEEPDWLINKNLNDAVIGDMPEDLSLEDQVMYIYCKLCKELKYDYNYYYRNFNLSHAIKPDFKKEKLENIKPGSKVSCWDFARVLSKFINNLDGEIKAYLGALVYENGKHKIPGIDKDDITRW